MLPFGDRVEGEVQAEMKKVEEEHEVLEPLNRMVDEQQVSGGRSWKVQQLQSRCDCVKTRYLCP